jgi:hypothetical protein
MTHSMSAFGGKADMSICGPLLSVKRTWLVAAHRSAFDPKRTCVGQLDIGPQSNAIPKPKKPHNPKWNSAGNCRGMPVLTQLGGKA